jgi:hypothetical protein
VKSIAMGGRPNRAPIQGVGGVKGAQSVTYDYIYAYAQRAQTLASATPAQLKILSKLTTLPMDRSTFAGVNLRDQILRGNLEDGLPAQFVYEAADCRLFYTREMVKDVTALWEAAANAAWGDGECVAGGFSKKIGAKTRGQALTKTERRAEERDLVLERRHESAKSTLWMENHRLKVIM